MSSASRSMTGMRRMLQSGKIPGAFLATRGSEIRQAYDQGRTAIFFQFQGCEPIGEQLWKLDLFYELGLRVLQITHHNNNPWGGGAIEKTWTGLTKVGFEGVERLNALNIMHLATPESAILSAIVFNALIIVVLIPLALKGVRYRALGAGPLLRRNLLVYGLTGLVVPFVGIKLVDLVLVALGLA